ncbi:hypothetical protein [Spirosoma areae]
MTENVSFILGQESVTVSVSTHTDFIECVEDIPSPFKHGQTILNPGLDTSNFEGVVIKCFIPFEERDKVSKERASGQSICHEVVEDFVRNNWSHKQVFQVETLNCSHFEQQYKYLVQKINEI